MNWHVLAIAPLAAVLTTSGQLRYEHGRFPFGEGAGKAFGWWAAMCLTDGALAALAAFGLTPTGKIDLASTGGWVRTALIGVLAPLALRSPIRSKQIAGAEQGIGVTYVYDRARLAMDSGLDERMTRLRRKDIAEIVRTLMDFGWTGQVLSIEVTKHLADRRKVSAERAASVRLAIENGNGMPTEQDHLETVVTGLSLNKFAALLEQVSAGPPAAPVAESGPGPLQATTGGG